MDPYSTHLPYLATAIKVLGGPVLELGGGLFSTPLVRGLRPHDSVTIETNDKWATELKKAFGERSILYTPNYQVDLLPLFKKFWRVVFVDLEFAEQRVWVVPQFENVDVFVLHDTENDYWNSTIEKFRYVRHFKELIPNTSYVSNRLLVDKI